MDSKREESPGGATPGEFDRLFPELNVRRIREEEADACGEVEQSVVTIHFHNCRARETARPQLLDYLKVAGVIVASKVLAHVMQPKHHNQSPSFPGSVPE